MNEVNKYSMPEKILNQVHIPLILLELLFVTEFVNFMYCLQ